MPSNRSRRSEQPVPLRPQERRAEPRFAANGQVLFRELELMGESFSGQLLDIAEHGFRARHKRLTLTSGQVVNFEFEGREGKASAIWTRIAGEEAESGFRILP